MSEGRDVKTTGWVDRGPEPRTGATAVPDPRAEAPAPAGSEPTAAVPAAPPAAGPAAGPGLGPDPLRPGPQSTQPVPHPGPPAVPPVQPREPAGAEAPGGQPTPPAGGRGRPRTKRPDPLIRMGPWAPVAGAALGLVLGIVVVLFLAPAVTDFAERLSLVFVVLGLSLLGAGGTLLADEVRMLRRGAQAVEVRSSSVDVIAGLLNGLTPARLLIMASAFTLLLSAYVTTRG
jgi:hypothetical protein